MEESFLALLYEISNLQVVMTGQELTTWAKNLKKIWNLNPQLEPVYNVSSDGELLFMGLLHLDGEEASIEVNNFKSDQNSELFQGDFFSIKVIFDFTSESYFLLWPNGTSFVHPYYAQSKWDEFEKQYLPHFHRQCWLSGGNIQCTAHERVEWKKWMDEQAW